MIISNNKTFVALIQRPQIICLLIFPVENSARIYDLLDLKETVSVISVEEENRIDCCAWSNDGRLLAITGTILASSIFLLLCNTVIVHVYITWQHVTVFNLTYQPYLTTLLVN